MTLRARTCPTHRQPMQRVLTTTAAGKDVELDRCGTCGALWFDAGELEQLASQRALPAGPGFSHFCPSCSDPAREPAVGGVFASARCNSCDGTFLDAATVARLTAEHLPRVPEPPAPRALRFRCARCEGLFTYAEGNATALGLVCRDCLEHPLGGGQAPAELGAVLDAVFRFLS